MRKRRAKDKKHHMRRILLLAALYVVAVVGFSFLFTERETEDLVGELAQATLPTVSFACGENSINESCGYTEPMNMTYLRSTITPIGEDRKLTVFVNTYGASIDGISYELRSMDGSRLLENGDISDYTKADNTLSAELVLQNLMDEGQEYVFALQIESEEKTISYYTRICKESADESRQVLAFVQNFHRATFLDEPSSLIANHIETSTKLAKSTLGYVDIHSSEEKIRWNGRTPQVVSAKHINIAEVSTYYYAVRMDYIVSMQDNGKTHYYNVEEYYRLRLGEDEIYLYDFERTTAQIFLGKEETYTDTSIELGIAGDDTAWLSNHSGTVTAFTTQGDLWLYDEENGELTQVFGFRTSDWDDLRTTNTDHSITILNVDETGTVQFVVNGYMSRGEHEGEVGVGVYRYSKLSNVVEEELWIGSDKSASVLALDTEQLYYVSGSNDFYLMAGETLYRINMESGSVQLLEKNLDTDHFLISESGRRIAWIEENGEDAEHSETIFIMDLETEKVTRIQADSGEYVQPIAFLDEDFVYGSARATDLITDAAGNTRFLMSKIIILDDNMELLKTYRQEDCFVLSTELEGDILHLNRVQKTAEGLAEIAEDTIVNYNRAAQTEVLVDISTEADGDSGRMALMMPNGVSNANPRLVYASMAIIESHPEVDVLRQEEDSRRYVVYRACRAVLATKNLCDAIEKANAEGGAVLGEGQTYIWRRGRGASISLGAVACSEATQEASTTLQCIDAILQYEGIRTATTQLLSSNEDLYHTMQELMSENIVLDLSGCTLSEVLYYVAHGTPVLAMTDADDAVLVVGYDSYNVTIYDPATGKTGKMTQDAAQELFRTAGDVYIGYLKS